MQQRLAMADDRSSQYRTDHHALGSTDPDPGGVASADSRHWVPCGDLSMLGDCSS